MCTEKKEFEVLVIRYINLFVLRKLILNSKYIMTNLFCKLPSLNLKLISIIVNLNRLFNLCK